MEDIFENLMKALDDYGQAVKDLYQKRLIADDKRATGNLIDSVQCKIAYQGINFVVFLELADYWRYVEDGRKPGRFPPVDKILEWVKIKPVLPVPMENGELPTEEQLAFLISRKIANEGIEAGHQLAETVEDLNKIYIPILEEALQKDFDLYTLKTFSDVGKMIKI